MFQNAIAQVSRFTRPLHTIMRTYGGKILPGSATLFFVNEDGVAITCKHVANLIPTADKLNAEYRAFRAERDRLARDNKYHSHLKDLELKYKYSPERIIQQKNNFLNCLDKLEQITAHMHPTLDLAILEFKGFTRPLYQSHAVFVKDSSTIRQGKTLCRIGFPFPEFNNFVYNQQTDDIDWTQTGHQDSPIFPMDGIITRFVATPGEGITGIELSTPGLRGQSGGPLFDADGHIYGMQFAANHLHLGFDITDREIIQDGKTKKVSNHPFLHVGLCVHVENIKAFLRQHNIKFYEA
jgi:hypothetical protein